MTRSVGAFGDVKLAIFAGVSVVTSTIVVIDTIGASSIIDARLRGAFVDINLTMSAFEAGVVAIAVVLVDAVHAEAAVETRLRFAFIDVDLAVSSGEARNAGTSVIVNPIHATGSV